MFLDKTEYQTSIDLSLYIEGLLDTDYVEVESKTKTEESIETILLNDLLVPEIVDAPTKLETKTEAIRVESKEKVEQNGFEKIVEKVVDQSIPLWGQERFKCLIVKSTGISLMIPALSVSYVERINKKIIRLPLDVEAFRGVLTLRERSVAVIDLYKLISENGLSSEQSVKNVEEQHVEHVIVMENGSYALACDEIGEIFELEPENVRWNKASFNNPIFAGIVPDHLCPIVNIDTIQQQIAKMPFVQSLNSNYLDS